MKDHKWITDEMFDEKLRDIINDEFGTYEPFDIVMQFGYYDDIIGQYNDKVIDDLDITVPKYYEEVFFAQGEYAESWIELLDISGEEKTLNEMLDYYWQPGNHMTRDESSAGEGDTIYRKTLNKEKDIVAELSYNLIFPCIGLCIKHRILD